MMHNVPKIQIRLPPLVYRLNLERLLQARIPRLVQAKRIRLPPLICRPNVEQLLQARIPRLVQVKVSQQERPISQLAQYKNAKITEE